MAEFYYLQGKLETRDLNRFLIIYGKNPLLRTTNFQTACRWFLFKWYNYHTGSLVLK